jgi:hypothetical protein
MSFEEFLNDVVVKKNDFQPTNREKWTVYFGPADIKNGFIREVSFEPINEFFHDLYPATEITSNVVKEWFVKNHMKSLDTYFFHKIVG